MTKWKIKEDTAKAMKEEGIDIKIISKITELTEEEIKQINKLIYKN